jgi:guanosine-3',5'-bis(diphosphate) 3'-pyrophosphohydrolase
VDENKPQRFPSQIRVLASNAPGTLAQIAQAISEHAGNIDNIKMERRSPDFTQLTIDIGVYDVKHLNAIIAQLRTKAVVSSAERVNG